MGSFDDGFKRIAEAEFGAKAARFSSNNNPHSGAEASQRLSEYVLRSPNEQEELVRNASVTDIIETDVPGTYHFLFMGISNDSLAKLIPANLYEIIFKLNGLVGGLDHVENICKQVEVIKQDNFLKQVVVNRGFISIPRNLSGDKLLGSHGITSEFNIIKNKILDDVNEPAISLPELGNKIANYLLNNLSHIQPEERNKLTEFWGRINGSAQITYKSLLLEHLFSQIKDRSKFNSFLTKSPYTSFNLADEVIEIIRNGNEFIPDNGSFIYTICEILNTNNLVLSEKQKEFIRNNGGVTLNKLLDELRSLKNNIGPEDVLGMTLKEHVYPSRTSCDYDDEYEGRGLGFSAVVRIYRREENGEEAVGWHVPSYDERTFASTITKSLFDNINWNLNFFDALNAGRNNVRFEVVGNRPVPFTIIIDSLAGKTGQFVVSFVVQNPKINNGEKNVDSRQSLEEHRKFLRRL